MARSLRSRAGRGVRPYTIFADSRVGKCCVSFLGFLPDISLQRDKIQTCSSIAAICRTYRKTSTRTSSPSLRNSAGSSRHRLGRSPFLRAVTIIEKGTKLHVAVVMPDHVHMILSPLIDEQRREVYSLVEIMRTIKSASAHLINRRLSRQGPVWQEESFDHVLRSSEGLDAKVECVLQNPVRKGLAADWREYPWAWQRQELPVAEMQPVVQKM